MMHIKELQKKVENIRRRLDPEVIEREKRIEKTKGLVKGAAIGSIIAGATALFLSPDSGKNNRKKAKEELEKAKEVLETNLNEGREKLSKVYELKKETIEAKKNMLKEKLDLNDNMNIIDDIDLEEIEEELATDEY
ncbi:YtxH domain-containing protein [Alkaliphilus sp. MSJ-5]|uniref:YtxH domain-containing protein n=1 Tax=Alkaliphilus flagellatus TaxID=2841507 RepID=A0ABS6G3R6_9FIRM|nr:YtxH domain-containing protein [Alkaliphilus flagellatus]MBU5677125.1 YtxH domain-containing protein [Alkaliphilus flagellatus]